jgi:hypothetical protein
VLAEIGGATNPATYFPFRFAIFAFMFAEQIGIADRAATFNGVGSCGGKMAAEILGRTYVTIFAVFRLPVFVKMLAKVLWATDTARILPERVTTFGEMSAESVWCAADRAIVSVLRLSVLH